MKFGNLTTKDYRTFTTVNGKISIVFRNHKSGHLHVQIKGLLRKSGLTACHSRVNKTELCIIATYILNEIDREGYSNLDFNWAQIFGSCFSVGAK